MDLFGFNLFRDFSRDAHSFPPTPLSSAEALKDFLVPSNGNALDDNHFSSNAGVAMRGQGETKYRENKSERSLCQISHNICTKGTISVPSVKRGQGDERA